VVQIHSPRPFFSNIYLERLLKAPCCHIIGIYGAYKYYKFDSIAVIA